jgi:small-conductance mechanosensitive channel
MVENISVRSFRLRHHNGPVYTIPFGEVKKVMNFSRDWVMMKLEMRVSSDTDLEKLRKIVKKVGQQMMEEPELSANLLQPLKSQGVNRMDDDGAFVIRVKFMCKPGEQFVLRREVFRRVQEAFAANGIRFAPKRVMVDAGPDVSEKQIAAAAISAETPVITKAQSDAL